MIRVEVPDATSAARLVHQLAGVFEPTMVVLDGDHREVRLEGQRESSRAVTQLLGTVEDWLQDAALDSTMVWLDGTRYTLARRSAQIASGR